MLSGRSSGLVLFAACLSGLVLLFSSSPASADYSIKWELSNPYRLFQKPEMTRFHRVVYDQLTEEERLTPILSVERRLSKHLPFGWAEGLLNKTCWSRAGGDFSKCINDRQNFLHPKSHKIWAEFIGGTLLERLSMTCRWELEDFKTGKTIAAPLVLSCGDRAELTVPYPTGGRLVMILADGTRVNQDIKIEDILIVGLGDSFASGEGNPDVPVRLSKDRHVVYEPGDDDKAPGLGYPTRVGEWTFVGDRGFMENKARWLSQSCHRSLYSHQIRASLQLAIANPQRAITFVGFACAGAEITHGLFLRFKGLEWSPVPPKLSQLSAAAMAQCGPRRAELKQYARAFGLDGKLEVLHDLPVYNCPRKKARKIDLLMLSVGGNDVGFSSLVANVIVKDTTNLKLIGGWMGRILNADQAWGHVAKLKLRYKALRRALHNVLHIPWKEGDRILLTGYPNMSFRNEGRDVCDNGDLGMTVSPVFSLSSGRAARAEKFADKLNDVMRDTANKYGWSYIDGHRRAFYAHGLCAVNGERPDSLAENLHLPFWSEAGWAPFNPAQYAPYASRERWFRTPNDAYLTGHLHLSGPVIRNIFKIKGFSQLQVLIAGTYSGAFHPTAEGQAVIADAVAIEAERVLAKYKK